MARYTKRYATAADVPMLENYPPLKEWLDKHDARCVWQIDRENASYQHDVRVEQWIVNGATVIIVLCAAKRGFDVYTACPALSIEASLLDAEKRVGLGEN